MIFWAVAGGLGVVAGALLWRVRRRLELEAEADRAFWARYRAEHDQPRALRG